MNNNQWVRVLGISMLAMMSGAQAAESGFYATASLGQSKQDVGLSNGFLIGFLGTPLGGVLMQVNPDNNEVDDDDWSWNGAIGYRINSYLAAELAYMDFGRADVSEHYTIARPPSPRPPLPFFPDEITRDFTSEVKGPAVSILGKLPIGGALEIFLRGGVLFAAQEIDRGLLSIPRSESFASEVWLGGLGVDWHFAQRWALRVEYQRTGELDANSTAGETELEQYAIGVLYRFSSK